MFKYPFQDTVVNTLTYCLPIYYRVLLENSLAIGICGGALYTMTYIEQPTPKKSSNEIINMFNNIINYGYLSAVFIVSTISITFGIMFVMGLPPIISFPIFIGGYCVRLWYLDNLK